MQAIFEKTTLVKELCGYRVEKEHLSKSINNNKKLNRILVNENFGKVVNM